MARDHGFTLLEALVALVILTLALTMVFGRLSTALRVSTSADVDRQAAAAAYRILAELGHSRPLTYGLSEGDAIGGLHWRLKITPTRERAPGTVLPRLEAHDIALTVFWTDRRSTHERTFSTIRLGAEQ